MIYVNWVYYLDIHSSYIRFWYYKRYLFFLAQGLKILGFSDYLSGQVFIIFNEKSFLPANSTWLNTCLGEAI